MYEALVIILIYGTVLGFTLALVAIGLSLIYGVARIINFAHGAFFAISAYSLYYFFVSIKLNLILSIFFSLVITALVGGALYRIALDRIRGMELNEMIVTLACAIATIEILREIFAPAPLGVPTFIPGQIYIGTYIVEMQRVLIVITSVISLILLWLFIKKTKYGIAMRAVAQDEDAAMLMGINPEFMSMLAMMVSAILAGFAGIIIAPTQTVALENAWYALLNGIAIVILGGLGSLWGSLVAAFIIGYAEVAVATFLSSHLKTVIALIAILVVLVIKPSGIFGKHRELEERV
jgi:branched-chain amino acid transport system permease protein